MVENDGMRMVETCSRVKLRHRINVNSRNRLDAKLMFCLWTITRVDPPHRG